MSFEKLKEALDANSILLAALVLKTIPDINATDDSFGPENANALTYALKSSGPEMVLFLLNQGANPVHLGMYHNTPLHLSTIYDRPDIVEALIKLGVDVNKRNSYGYTSLHLAIRNETVRCAEILLKAGADTSAQDREGYTALHEAVVTGHVHLVSLLLSWGADSSLANADGLLPHQCTQDEEMVAILRNSMR